MANMRKKKMAEQPELEEKKELEEFYKNGLKDFARHYVAMWNALKSLGLSDPQVKGAISQIFEACGIDFKEAVNMKGD